MSTGHITALVTGANRGLGKHFASQLVDITDPTSVRRVADLAGVARQPRPDVLSTTYQ
jgi:NAD(P)-dependent dehydrogenase (short-subunit alcohol dehydrogenase family)